MVKKVKPDERRRKRSIQKASRAVRSVMDNLTRDGLNRIRAIPADEWSAAVQAEQDQVKDE